MTLELSIYLNEQLGVFLNKKTMKLAKNIKKRIFKPKTVLYGVIFCQILVILIFENFLRGFYKDLYKNLFH